MPIFTANHISLSTLNVCTNNVDEINAREAEKSIYAFILAMKLDKKVLSNYQCKVHHVNAKCTMVMQSAKCTTSMMLYKQKQPPLKVRASAMLLFQSIHASMRVKITNDLSVPYVAIDVITNSTLYTRFVSFGVFYQP
jgi:hypothetical protein